MAAVLQLAARPNGTGPGAGATSYFRTGIVGLASSATETNVQRTERAAGVYSNLYVRIVANATTGGTTTCRFRKNLANANQTFTITTGTTGEFEDTSNTDTVAAGDETAVLLTCGTGGGITASVLSQIFAATADTYANLVFSNNLTSPTASTTYFNPLVSLDNTLVTTEANRQTKMKNAGTFKNLFANVSANARATATTLRIRKNNANGNLVISITGSTTGLFEDTANSDTYAVDDLIGSSVTTGTGSGNVTFFGACGQETTDGSAQLVLGLYLTNIFSASLTRYLPVSGGIDDLTTELNVRAEVNYAPTASKLEAYISANTIVGNSTIHLRIDGANGNQAVTLTGLTTGWFEDASNTDVLTAAQEINYSLVTGAAGSTLTLQTVGMLLTVTTTAFMAKALMQQQAVKRAAYW